MTLFNTFMARITDWNNVHSVFFVVTVMMVIMLRLFSTYYARQGRSGRNLSASRGILNSISSSKFFGKFQALSSITFSSNLFPSLCLEICLLHFFDCFIMFAMVFFMGCSDFLFIVFTVFFNSIYITLFTVRVAPIFFYSMNTKFTNIFYYLTTTAFLFHFDLKNKTPITLWVKHKITGKIDFTIRSDCLTQPLVYSNYNIGGIKYA